MKEKQQFIDSVFGLIEKGSNLISEENKSVEKSVLIIGSTGSGKSTLLSYLKGDELVAKPIEDDFTEGFIIDYAQKKK
jgi:ABC-type lipoprotein export system ATPase subunit